MFRGILRTVRCRFWHLQHDPDVIVLCFLALYLAMCSYFACVVIVMICASTAGFGTVVPYQNLRGASEVLAVMKVACLVVPSWWVLYNARGPEIPLVAVIM
jgi:hypothetical protein